MEIALIGLSSSGKTTLFSALTGGSSGSDSPGSTRGRVQVGVARVQDPRLDALVNIFGPQKVTPAEITYWDIPPATGEGGQPVAIGGQVLNQLQAADAFIHVVRAFQDPAVPHPHATVGPLQDVATMQSDIALSDLVILDRRSQRIEASMKGAPGHERDLFLQEQELLERVRESLEKGKSVLRQSLSAKEARFLASYQLLTAKPLLVAHNIGEESLTNRSEIEGLLLQTREQYGLQAVALYAKLERELAQLPPNEEREFRISLGVEESGVQLLVQQLLAILGMGSFFTFASQEVKAWTVPRGTPAARAAGSIHSDMERGFIRAEVVSFGDMVACGSIAEARKRGVLRSEGKTYPVQDGDVITFLFNV